MKGRLPNIGDSDDGSIVVNHTAATQPPPSMKVHALDRLASGTKKRATTTQERCSELTGMHARLQGSKKSVLKSPFIIVAQSLRPGRLAFLSATVFISLACYIPTTSSSWVVVGGCQRMLPCFLNPHAIRCWPLLHFG